MVKSSFLFLFLISTFFVLDCLCYKFSEVKQLLLKFNISPNSVFYNPSYHDICTCGGVTDPVSKASDNDEIKENLLLVYDKVSLNDCPSGKTYATYRVLLNQSDVNNGICLRGNNSRDISDCKIFEEPKTPPPVDNATCSEECRKLIGLIPKGEKGDKGDKGDQGLKGDKGDKGDKGLDGVSGSDKSPSRKKSVERSFADLKKAFQNYTGCAVGYDAYVSNWFYNPTIPTMCYRSQPRRVLLKDATDSTLITSGYVIFHYYQEPEYLRHTYMALAYRTVENDIVPVMCQRDMSPIFLKRMDPIMDEINCPPMVPEGGVYKFSYWYIPMVATLFVLPAYWYKMYRAYNVVPIVLDNNINPEEVVPEERQLLSDDESIGDYPLEGRINRPVATVIIGTAS